MNLHEVMNEKGGYSIDEIIIFLERMVLNLKCLQKNDIVHRDIKPANIITYGNDYFLIDLVYNEYVDIILLIFVLLSV